MKANYTKAPDQVLQFKEREICIFNIDGKNIDRQVVNEFGEEWLKFNTFTDEAILAGANEYFELVDESIVNKKTYVLDVGCGTGRWTKFFSSKAGFIEAVDPSNAIFAANKLLAGIDNIRLTRASIETLPFEDETFDFAMSVGVLHHIPDTQKAMQDCVKKIKRGGYFYVYLSYNFDKRGGFFKRLFKISDIIRTGVSRLPAKLKNFATDVLAVFLYMPLVLWVRILRAIGLKKVAEKMPLSAYYNKPFFVIRNDSLDRFGTRLEQRFSEDEIRQMMMKSGLGEIIVSQGVPLYHAIGKKL
jgi:ubiquinone/menaquinone biosynthesis C-methylase UbiE